MEMVTGLSPWEVVMSDDSVLVVSASGYTDVGTDRVFTVLVDASIEEQASLEVISRTPNDPRRADVVLVRIPIAQIKSTVGG